MAPWRTEESRTGLRDRIEWAPGPWDAEPEDRILFTTKHGYAGELQRNHSGAWCGYVSVSKGHPAFGDRDLDFDVHGGITFRRDDEGAGFSWTLGFDCFHSYDQAPLQTGSWSGIYRTRDYARAEVERLSEQLYALENRSEER